MSELSAFELLGKIRDKAIQFSGEGITYSIQSTGVKNIAYLINGINFYCDAAEVKEVSTSQNIMRVPQTKRWMRGIVNSKGVLYSVTDLCLFAGYDRPIKENRGHLLLLADANKQSALLVNRVIGFRYFEGGEKISQLDNNDEIPDGLSPFVSEAYKVDNEIWYCLNVRQLLESEQFREVQ